MFGAIENNRVYLFPHSCYLDLHIKSHTLNIYCYKHTPIMQALRGSTKDKMVSQIYNDLIVHSQAAKSTSSLVLVHRKFSMHSVMLSMNYSMDNMEGFQSISQLHINILIVLKDQPCKQSDLLLIQRQNLYSSFEKGLDPQTKGLHGCKQ